MSTVDLLRCDICHGLEPLCKVCERHQAFRQEGVTATCQGCGEDAEDPYLASPLDDPRGCGEAHYFHHDCLPEGCIAVA